VNEWVQYDGREYFTAVAQQVNSSVVATVQTVFLYRYQKSLPDFLRDQRWASAVSDRHWRLACFTVQWDTWRLRGVCVRHSTSRLLLLLLTRCCFFDRPSRRTFRETAFWLTGTNVQMLTNGFVVLLLMSAGFAAETARDCLFSSEQRRNFYEPRWCIYPGHLHFTFPEYWIATNFPQHDAWVELISLLFVLFQSTVWNKYMLHTSCYCPVRVYTGIGAGDAEKARTENAAPKCRGGNGENGNKEP